MRHIPNILSGIRLLLVGVFIAAFLSGRYLAALSVFIFAFFTDILDGQLARQNGWVSNLGKLLDPLADKLMTVAALVCIYVGKGGGVYLTIFVLVGVKELLMVLGGLFMARRGVVAYSDWMGKLATGLFTVGIMLTLLTFASEDVGNWNLVVLFCATALSYATLIHYAVTQLPRALKPAAPEEPPQAKAPSAGKTPEK